jgi:glycosyltransferase involved in cell wall biosynthesis
MDNHRTTTTPRSRPLNRLALGSVVIPAHDEAGVIRRCLDSLFSGFEPGEIDVVVVCNGCSDDTAELARSSGHPLRVIELGDRSKPAALRAGDLTASAFPRLYLDADVVLPGPAARSVMARLQAGAVAARPPIAYDFCRSSAAVRSYYRARSRVPSVLGSLWGAGVYGLSAAGRARFDEFPDVVADDLWLDRQFERNEVEIVDSAPVVVVVPRRSRELLRMLRRVYRGKAEHPPTLGVDERAHHAMLRTLGDLLRLLITGPAAGLDAATYVGFAAGARLALALAAVTGRKATLGRWERDDSSRGVT